MFRQVSKHQAATFRSLSLNQHRINELTAIHRLATRDWLQKRDPPPPPPMLKCPTLQQKTNVYSLVQKVVLVYIANFAFHENCEEGDFYLDFFL